MDRRTVAYVLDAGQAALRDQSGEDHWARINEFLLIAALAAGLTALTLGFVMARSITRRVRELTQATHAMSQRQMEQRVTVRSQDELGKLPAAFIAVIPRAAKAADRGWIWPSPRHL